MCALLLLTKSRNLLVDSIGKNPDKALNLLQSIAKIVQATNQKAPYSKKVDQILTITLNYLGVEQGTIMVLERKKLLVVAATREDLVGVKQEITEESIAGWVAKNKTPIFIPDISKDRRFSKRSGPAYKKNSLLSAPIMQEKKLIGVINVTDKSGDKDLLQEDVTYLLDFGSLMISSLVQQRLQNELKRQRNTLRLRNQELKRQEKMRDELSRMLIHDLKSPLSEVIANLDILSYSITGENQEFLEAAQISCDRTVRMVGNLVTINKIEDGKMTLFKEEIDVRNLLEESYSAIKGLTKIKEVQLALDLPDEELPTIHLDRVLILRVLQNLLTNALGYTTAKTKIVLGCRPAAKNNYLEFFVQDQGPGIPLHKQNTVFDKYSRVSDSHDTLVGTGLGLYFCKLAVELHKGAIGIESSGNGSRFFFTLPM
jgi:two-component system sensor histidine kinase KdpD